MVTEFSMVECFLTASIVHFPAMKSTMENVWHPIRGVQISDLRDKRFLFKFFYRMDLERVINGAHWTFNNHLMVFHRLEKGEDPVNVPLLFVNFWVQVHDLPKGLFSKTIARQLREFLGKFLEYDSKSLIRGDLSLQAQSRRATAMFSVWLVESRDEGGLGTIVEQRGLGQLQTVRCFKNNLRQVYPQVLVTGGLPLGWVESLTINLRTFSRSHIDVEVWEGDGGVAWRFTGFYGTLVEQIRKDLWNLLRHLKQESNLSWEVLDECELSDLGFSGQWFTWERGRFLENNMREWLDRGRVRAGLWDSWFRFNANWILEEGFGNHLKRWWATNDKRFRQSLGMKDCDRLLLEIPTRASRSQNEESVTEFRREEVVEMIRAMDPLKASGKDGFPTLFYQKF
ncbi:hypothetical protein Gorai_015016 [Gossypium raimondii]|uniref:DUF4283 domain-containing protein n=1 Tax=Gossypium raimondii TaxID=29730 RepID=A0A7J8P4L3_GOSRA|nr:hypothetical protein [Gossypium raimondii]